MNQKKLQGVRLVAVRLGTVFIIVVLVLTFFSGSIENAMLPEVTTYPVNNQKVTTSSTAMTTPSYENPVTVYAPVTAPVLESYLQYGVGIKEGEPVAQLDKTTVDQVRTDYEVQLMEARNSISQLQSSLKKAQDTNADIDDQIAAANKSNAALDPTDPASESLKINTKSLERQKVDTSIYTQQIEVAQIKYNALEKEFTEAFQYINEEGQFLAPAGGMVVTDNITLSGNMVQGEVAYVYGVLGSPMILEWSTSIVEGTRFTDAATITATTGTDTFTATLIDRKVDQETGVYVFRARIPGDKILQITTRVTVTVSTPESSNLNVVPKVVLHQDNGNYVYVLRMDSEKHKYYVKRLEVTEYSQATPLEYSIIADFQDGDEVILSTTRTLEDGMQVRLK